MTPLMPRFGDDADDLMAHQILRDLNDHERELGAIPGREVCDFCNAADPVWQYGCEDVTLVTTMAVTPSAVGSEDHNSTGEWAACEKCKFLVDRSEVKKLADRSARSTLESLKADHPELADHLPSLASVRRDTTELHQGFWKNRRRDLDRPFTRRQHTDRRR